MAAAAAQEGAGAPCAAAAAHARARAPDGPTTASDLPGATRSVTPRSTRRAGEYPKCTSSMSTASPRAGAAASAPRPLDGDAAADGGLAGVVGLGVLTAVSPARSPFAFPAQRPAPLSTPRPTRPGSLRTPQGIPKCLTPCCPPPLPLPSLFPLCS